MVWQTRSPERQLQLRAALRPAASRCASPRRTPVSAEIRAIVPVERATPGGYHGCYNTRCFTPFTPEFPPFPNSQSPGGEHWPPERLQDRITQRPVREPARDASRDVAPQFLIRASFLFLPSLHVALPLDPSGVGPGFPPRVWSAGGYKRRKWLLFFLLPLRLIIVNQLRHLPARCESARPLRKDRWTKAPLQATELGACVFFSSIHTRGPEWAHSGPLEGARVGGGGGSVRPVDRFAPDGLCKKESKRVSRRNSMTQHPRDGLRDVGPGKTILDKKDNREGLGREVTSCHPVKVSFTCWI